ncbi:hypothetical protein [Leptolyngbya phage Lbo-JY46]
MGLNQSFRQVFVTNSPALLAQGKTVENLAVGQIAILDGHTNRAVTAPTYATSKSLSFVWGTPDIEGRVTLMTGVPNENIYSKLVKGKKIKGWRGKAAKRGRNQIVTVGFSGDVTDTDTLFAYGGDVRHLFLNLTGAPIDKFYTKQGLMRQYSYEVPFTDNCSTDCEAVGSEAIAENLVAQINSDPQVNRFIKASVVKSCAVGDTTPCYRFEVSVCDTRDQIALGLVQAQYPDFKVTRKGVNGANSVYEIIKDTNTLPAALSNAGFVVIPNCDVCPAGYTREAGGFVYTVAAADSSSNISSTLVSKINAAHPTASAYAVKVSNGNYVVVTQIQLTTSQVETAIEASSGPAVSAVVFKYETNRDICVITTPTTTAWTLVETLQKFSKTYRVTVADSVCGTTRLADIQAAYPDLTVSLVDADGDCVHTYEATVESNCVPISCSLDEVKFTAPVPFEQSRWVEVPGTSTANCLCGIKIETAFVNRITNECTYDHFSYEADPVHIHVSSFDPDYNNSPSRKEWNVKQIQSIQYPAGHGVEIRKWEQRSKSYDLRERSHNPVVREIEGSEFIADPNKFYDEYVLEFDFDYKTGGWSEKYVDSYHLFFYFPEGNGKTFETAINAYIASVGSDLDPVIL